MNLRNFNQKKIYIYIYFSPIKQGLFGKSITFPGVRQELMLFIYWWLIWSTCCTLSKNLSLQSLMPTLFKEFNKFTAATKISQFSYFYQNKISARDCVLYINRHRTPFAFDVRSCRMFFCFNETCYYFSPGKLMLINNVFLTLYIYS